MFLFCGNRLSGICQYSKLIDMIIWPEFSRGGGQTKHMFPFFSGLPSHKEYVPLNQVWGLSVTSFRNLWVKRRQIFCFEILSLSCPLKYMDKRSKNTTMSLQCINICYIWEKMINHSTRTIISCNNIYKFVTMVALQAVAKNSVYLCVCVYFPLYLQGYLMSYRIARLRLVPPKFFY